MQRSSLVAGVEQIAEGGQGPSINRVMNQKLTKLPRKHKRPSSDMPKQPKEESEKPSEYKWSDPILPQYDFERQLHRSTHFFDVDFLT